MSQAPSFTLPNQSRTSYRLAVNTVFAALASGNAGATAPPEPHEFMLWPDTSGAPTVLIKQRNASNTQWLTVAVMDGAGVRPYRNGTVLGDAATRTVGTAANNIVALEAGGMLPAVDGSQLTNLPIAADTARLHALSSVPMSGVSFREWTALPAGIAKLSLAFSNVSLSGSDFGWLQLGAAAYSTSGYAGRSTFVSVTTYGWSSAAIVTGGSVDASVWDGHVEIIRTAATVWTIAGVAERQDFGAMPFSGSVDIGGELARVRLIASGANTFDGGTAAGAALYT